jgi:hypothetical protein
LQAFSFLKRANHKDDRFKNYTAEERDELEIKENAEKLNKILTTNDELTNIRKAKRNWAMVRTKKRVILMMATLGEAVIHELD